MRDPSRIFDAINLALPRGACTNGRTNLRQGVRYTQHAIEVVASHRALILFNLIARGALLVKHPLNTRA